jgi:hypothetical protein
MASSYLPTKEIDLSEWLANFANEITSKGATFDFTPEEITALTGVITAARSSLDAARTAQENAAAARQTKDANFDAAVEDVRAAVKRLQSSPAMTDTVRAAFRITIPASGRTPAPPPTTRPLPAVQGGQRLEHTLKIADETDPTRRARRPEGVAECEVRMVVQAHDEMVPADPLKMPIIAMSSKTTVTQAFSGEQACKTAWYCARWRNSRGETGPWSQMVSATIAA